MQLITQQDLPADTATAGVLQLSNDAELLDLTLDGVTRIDLHFPKFSDGRAFTQAVTLRRRLGFQGEIRATGDVLIDQLVQMRRSGFDAAVLREGLSPGAAQRQWVDGDSGPRYENFITTLRRVGHDPFKAAANATRQTHKQAA